MTLLENAAVVAHMNIERGSRRIVIVVTFPMLLIGLAFAIGGYWKASSLNRSVLRLESEMAETMAESVESAQSKKKTNSTLSKAELELAGLLAEEIEDQKRLIQNYKSYSGIGLLLMGAAGLIWALFCVIRWVANGFKNGA